MRRRIASLLSAAFVAVATGHVTTASPAAASGLCAGAGQGSVGAALLFPFAGAPVTTSFGFVLGIGTCINTGGPTLKTLQAVGTMVGWCGHNSGTGATTDGFRFAWVTVGTVLVATGGLIGTAVVVPQATSGDSCFTGAVKFLITGAFAKVHCAMKTKVLATVDVLPPVLTTTEVLTAGVTAHVVTGPMHYWAKACAPSVIL